MYAGRALYCFKLRSAFICVHPRLHILQPDNSCAKLVRRQSVPEGLHAVYHYHGNIVLISLQQDRIAFDVYIGKPVRRGAVSRPHCLLSFFTKMAPGSRVDDHLNSHSVIVTSLRYACDES